MWSCWKSDMLRMWVTHRQRGIENAKLKKYEILMTGGPERMWKGEVW